MDFEMIAVNRQSCRAYDSTRMVEQEKLMKILQVTALSPSACNGQPYHLTVCTGDLTLQVAKATSGMGLNKFATQAPVLIVMSEEPYVRTAAMGAKLKGNDYRSMDIGIASAYLTAMATELGLSTCILGWFDDKKIRELCHLTGAVRLVITLGYAKEDDPLRKKKRKSIEDLVTFL